MKALVRWTVLVLLLAGGVVAQTQNLVGQWQGTLAVQGKELRLVFVIAAAGQGNTLTATTYSIDQGPGGIGAAVAVQGGNVRITVAPLNATFEGKLSADGNSIAGTFTQGAPVPLTLARANKDSAWALPAPPKTMAPDAPTVFEVATIKPNNSGNPGKGFTVRGREILTINTSLADLLTFAYNIHLRQIVNGPSWMENDKYDITGRPQAEGVPNDRQIRAMIKNLVIERFKLTVHTDSKELPAYVLTVVSSGPKLTENTSNPNGLPGLGFGAPGRMRVVNATMGDFASVMQGTVLDRPVVDKTGLKGRYDFTLNWTPDEGQFRGIPIPPQPKDDPNAPPGLFTAIQEQIGIKMDRTNAPVEVIVIDKVDKPTDN
jgi:uncharacterized protein (TIGR03435 family)